LGDCTHTEEDTILVVTFRWGNWMMLVPVYTEKQTGNSICKQN